MKRVLIAMCLIIGCAPHGERVLGDYGTQPETKITLLPGHDAAAVGPVVASAKKAVAAYVEHLWPEPSNVVEQDEEWRVWFDYRQQRIERDGKELVLMSFPSSSMVVVQKSDLSAKIIPGR